ncbi:hypothetical protein GCM10023215_24430 [Pseudonocardia yuanmonensis]|uniref:Uncharacterized protein n=1 Tax=Pseudonocardia yuanmonensis TaxID=1095914 RepID=A0ABP8WF21_9PSEU
MGGGHGDRRAESFEGDLRAVVHQGVDGVGQRRDRGHGAKLSAARRGGNRTHVTAVTPAVLVTIGGGPDTHGATLVP